MTSFARRQIGQVTSGLGPSPAAIHQAMLGQKFSAEVGGVRSGWGTCGGGRTTAGDGRDEPGFSSRPCWLTASLAAGCWGALLATGARAGEDIAGPDG